MLAIVQFVFLVAAFFVRRAGLENHPYWNKVMPSILHWACNMALFFMPVFIIYSNVLNIIYTKVYDDSHQVKPFTTFIMLLQALIFAWGWITFSSTFTDMREHHEKE